MTEEEAYNVIVGKVSDLQKVSITKIRGITSDSSWFYRVEIKYAEVVSSGSNSVLAYAVNLAMESVRDTHRICASPGERIVAAFNRYKQPLSGMDSDGLAKVIDDSLADFMKQNGK